MTNWIISPTKTNWKTKWSKIIGMTKVKPMMWMLLAKEVKPMMWMSLAKEKIMLSSRRAL